MSARESKGPLPAYEQLCASCTGVYWLLYAWPVEHSGDAAGIVPAVADVPGRATLHHLKFLRIVMCVGSHRRRYIIPSVV